jgi:hypothetical protein
MRLGQGGAPGEQRPAGFLALARTGAILVVAGVGVGGWAGLIWAFTVSLYHARCWSSAALQLQQGAAAVAVRGSLTICLISGSTGDVRQF